MLASPNELTTNEILDLGRGRERHVTAMQVPTHAGTIAEVAIVGPAEADYFFCNVPLLKLPQVRYRTIAIEPLRYGTWLEKRIGSAQ